MKLLDRYIAKTVLSAIALVTLMLAGLQIFILFVNQLDDLGKADFGIVQAAFFVLLQMPYQVYLFFPMASLLGCLIGLGILANHSELVVMRAAGMSITQITLAIFKVSVLLILLVTVIGEMFIPRMASYANDFKMSSLSKGQTLRTAKGVWLRDQNRFIMIGAIMPNHVLRLVYQFQFDTEHRMQSARLIDQIRLENKHWQAYNINETRFHKDNRTSSHHIDSMPWDVAVNPAVLSISGNEPDEMSLKQLRRFIREQKRNKQNVMDYKLAYWQRLIQPLTTMVMMILAIPFIFGPLRSSTMGSKFLIGATVGFGFYIVNRFFGPVSMVYQWPAELAAVGPTLMFSIIGVYLMRRVR
ncbi:LPS export ABC transporter permease LptG [Legionella israelensis]|uniref:LPS export ABC transporter permease LptG n=1 Tax=Legionella israelensis TaxID=454 RepID=A0A0W0WNA8_9GAMM|nr:LPS export ABC transporter permease LptG [Legionella israelensis]KTD33775.1 hypothetical protein Lisr_0308 [Legionella israelensis]QBR83354.1 LPS export ABC transporter permease LptG [Legionella israelensis]QBS09268.1 LPS export ABC transporter permease LptG [Legionella israelensis]QDP71880.1 LPS export ABC transporter permease LptG [Legionella israelensis]SCY31781.1 lipopolysaccharide export system permease protein [Legionella israelensis DSM 19235]